MSWVLGITLAAILLLLGSAFKDLLISQYQKVDNQPNRIADLKGFIPDSSDVEAANKLDAFIYNQAEESLTFTKTLTPKNWHNLVLNWDYDMPFDKTLAWILGHPDCDKGTAQAMLSINLIEIAEYGFEEKNQNILHFLKLSRAASERLYSNAFPTSHYLPFRKGMAGDYFRAVEISEGHYLKNPAHYSIEFRKRYFLP
jgi:hypothetical protein